MATLSDAIEATRQGDTAGASNLLRGLVGLPTKPTYQDYLAGKATWDEYFDAIGRDYEKVDPGYLDFAFGRRDDALGRRTVYDPRTNSTTEVTGTLAQFKQWQDASSQYVNGQLSYDAFRKKYDEIFKPTLNDEQKASDAAYNAPGSYWLNQNHSLPITYDEASGKYYVPQDALYSGSSRTADGKWVYPQLDMDALGKLGAPTQVGDDLAEKAMEGFGDVAKANTGYLLDRATLDKLLNKGISAFDPSTVDWGTAGNPGAERLADLKLQSDGMFGTSFTTNRGNNDQWTYSYNPLHPEQSTGKMSWHDEGDDFLGAALPILGVALVASGFGAALAPELLGEAALAEGAAAAGATAAEGAAAGLAIAPEVAVSEAAVDFAVPGAMSTSASSLGGGAALAGTDLAGVIGTTGGAMSTTAGALAATAPGMAVAAPITGGLIVGSQGLIGSTGNAVADAALNGAAQNALVTGATGGDPLEGALKGAVASGFAAALGNPAQSLEIEDPATAAAVNNAASGAISGGVSAAANGGNILEGAAIGAAAGGAGGYVGATTKDWVDGMDGANTIANAAGGATTGAVNAVLTGGDVGNGILTGAAAGAAGGLMTDIGVPELSGLATGIVGGAVGAALQPDPVVQTPETQSPATTTDSAPWSLGLGFSSAVEPVWSNRRPEWGTRMDWGT